VLVVALVVAAAAAGAVYLYTDSVRKEAESGVQVIVAKQDIATGTTLDALIDENQFTIVEVPEDIVIAGAVTDLEQLRGRVNSSPILAGEQIPSARLAGGEEVTGGRFGIEEGFQAMSVRLDAQRNLANQLQVGDKVTLYASFSDAKIVRRFARGISGGALNQAVTQDQTVFEGDFTVALVQDVKLLAVNRIGGGGSDAPVGGEQAATESILTLEMLPQDVADTVFSMEFGTVWMSLLPPDGKPARHDVVTIGRILFEGVREQP
jgi:pilus assembly protein CpaB